MFLNFYSIFNNELLTGVDVDFHDKILFYPATFICPEDPINYTKLEKIFHNSKLTENERKLLTTLPALTYKSLLDLEIPENVGNIIGSSKTIQDFIKSYIVTCQEYLIECKLKDEIIDCCQYFHLVFTEQQPCFVFNQHQFLNQSATIYIFETDVNWKLEFVTRNITNNVKIYFKSIYGMVNVNTELRFTWQHNLVSTILLEIVEFFCADNVRSLTMWQRKCAFDNEVKYMPKGSSARQTIMKCQCVKLSVIN